MHKLLFTMIIVVFSTLSSGAQVRVGDPGVIPDPSKYDSDYPQMERWAKTGVRGGIPFIDSFDKTATINPGTTADIQAVITSYSIHYTKLYESAMAKVQVERRISTLRSV